MKPEKLMTLRELCNVLKVGRAGDGTIFTCEQMERAADELVRRSDTILDLDTRSRRKAKTVLFTVAGRGVFPMDMLRQDQAYPRSENDALAAQCESMHRKVILARDDAPMNWCPTLDRWKSFGWEVLSVDEVKE